MTQVMAALSCYVGQMAIPTHGGVYEYEFVDPPSDTLVGKICHYLSREPHLTGCCGYTYCESCLKGMK